MSEKEIIEGNRIIAEYICAEKIIEGHITPFYKINETQFGYDFQLEFDKSWDWTMPVYKKISTDLKNMSERLKSHKGSTWVSKQAMLHHINDLEAYLKLALWGVRIGDFYIGIVGTIKWYNENKKL